MKSRHVVRERTVGRGAAGLILALLLAPFLLMFTASTASAVDTLCLPGPDKACIAGTLRSNDGVLPDVTITITDEAGTAQEVTTSDTGKWNVQVEERGQVRRQDRRVHAAEGPGRRHR